MSPTSTLPSGRHRLHLYSIHPTEPAHARLLILHGYGEHAGRYLHFMQWMADRGVVCHAFDFRGHGLSTGKRASIYRWDEYLQDLNAVLACNELKDNADHSSPLFVLGHSHGGLVAVAAGIANQLPVAGVILSAPYLQLKMPVPPHRRIFAAIASFLLPTFPVKSGVGGPMLTRDPEMIEQSKTDPHCRGVATPRWFTTVRQTQAEVRAHSKEFTLPLLMLIAGDDSIADASASVAFYENCGSKDKTIHQYEGFRHELLRELGREKIFDQIHNWITTRSAVISPL